jgi:ureidoglycolate dehydrogenase (NAD+)
VTDHSIVGLPRLRCPTISGRNALKTITVPVDVLHHFLKRIFIALGCDAENASIITDGLIEADLRGHRIQGTDHIYSIVADLKAGRLNGRARPHVARQTAATAQIDGDGGGGHVGGRFAVDVAVEKAKIAGVAAVGLVRAGDIFMLGAYVERIARTGLVGMAFTNTVPTRVHPAGGIDPAIGTNPMGFAFPTFDDDPVIMDLATSTSAVGHIRIASYSGAPIPSGVAIDQNGVPTTDAMQALAGALTPLGGHKGFALGLASALLSGPMVGADLGSKLKAQTVASNQIPDRGHFFVAIDPATFGDLQFYRQRVREYLGELKSGRKALGISEIQIPGERSMRQRRRSLATGIEMLESVWQHTIDIARQSGVEAPALRG